MSAKKYKIKRNKDIYNQFEKLRGTGKTIAESCQIISSEYKQKGEKISIPTIEKIVFDKSYSNSPLKKVS